MTIIPRDIGEAKRIGYTFNLTVAESIRIINQHFKGLDLMTLIHDLERLLEPYAEKPISREIAVTDPPPEMRIGYKSNNYLDEQEGLCVSRNFNYIDDELIVYHEWLQLPDGCRDQGLGKKITSAFLEQYEKMGVKKINLYAALSDGGAVWAKFGFKATNRVEMERILQSAEQELVNRPLILKVVKDTFDNYYGKEPDGASFPIQNWVNIPAMESILKRATGHWHGRLDLTNPKDLSNFKLYVGKKD